MEEKNSPSRLRRSKLGFMLQLKTLKFLCVGVCLLMKFKEVNSQEILTISETTFCYNSSLEGFRLNTTVLEVRSVSSRSTCVDECFADPCCRSINYEHSFTAPKCEFLHDLVENKSFALEKNTSFDHFFFLEPVKEYNPSCFPAEKTHASCKDVFEQNSSAPSGVYILQLNDTSETYKAYCHMPTITECGGGAWTLVMKLDGDKETFKYNSSLWTTNATLNVEEGLAGRTENETKLASYHYTPFTKICLAVKMDNDDDNETSFVLINHTARSLYSVIADGNYTATYFNAAMLMTEIKNTSVQPNCTRQGFNLKFDDEGLNLRIGFTANIEPNCTTPDTVVGFGIGKKNFSAWSNGLVENSTQYSKAFGYILVH